MKASERLAGRIGKMAGRDREEILAELYKAFGAGKPEEGRLWSLVKEWLGPDAVSTQQVRQYVNRYIYDYLRASDATAVVTHADIIARRKAQQEAAVAAKRAARQTREIEGRRRRAEGVKEARRQGLITRAEVAAGRGKQVADRIVQVHRLHLHALPGEATVVVLHPA